MGQELATLLEAISKAGPTAALVAAIILFLWRVLPTMLKHWQVQTRQSQTVTENIPRIEVHLSRMADDHSRMLARIDTVTTGSEHKVSDILMLVRKIDEQTREERVTTRNS